MHPSPPTAIGDGIMRHRSPKPALHPAQWFKAPRTMQRGVPLAHLIGRQAVALLAESMAAVHPAFERGRFTRAALGGLDDLGLTERAAHVALALATELPQDFDAAADVLVASFGPELEATEGNGLAPFYYLPHSQYVSLRGVGHLESGMRVCYELTKRFTAEFCVRPFLVSDQEGTMEYLTRWAADPNPHVRRLVSEGTRPRLPWGLRLNALQDDPRPGLGLLERLKDDPVPYVYRSVANHLGDVLKDNPDLGYATCERWVAEAKSGDLPPDRVGSRLWVVRHALRLPAKKGETRAVRLRRLAQAKP